MEQTVNLSAIAFGGSNPPLPTKNTVILSNSVKFTVFFVVLSVKILPKTITVQFFSQKIGNKLGIKFAKLQGITEFFISFFCKLGFCSKCV